MIGKKEGVISIVCSFRRIKFLALGAFLFLGAIPWGICSKPVAPVEMNVSIDHLVSKRNDTSVTVRISPSYEYPHVRLQANVKACIDVVDCQKSDVTVHGIPHRLIELPKKDDLKLNLVISFARPQGEYSVEIQLLDPNNNNILDRKYSFLVEDDVVFGGMYIDDCIGVKCCSLLGIHQEERTYSSLEQERICNCYNQKVRERATITAMRKTND